MKQSPSGSCAINSRGKHLLSFLVSELEQFAHPTTLIGGSSDGRVAFENYVLNSVNTEVCTKSHLPSA